MKNLKEKGITLVALVITIIILLILAGISIGIVTGENGLIQKAKIAREKYESESQHEENDLIYIGEVFDNQTGVAPPSLEKGDIEFILNPSEWTNTAVKVSIKVNINLKLNKLQTSRNGTDWTDYEEGQEIEIIDNKTTIYARLWSGLKAGGYASETIENIDREEPNEFAVEIEETTVNSIKVKGHTTDKDETEINGKSEIKGYKFSKDDGETWTECQEEESYTFYNLDHKTSYKIKIKAVDKAGNERETETKEETTKTITAGVVIGNPEWDTSSHTATVTLSKAEGIGENLYIQYKVEGKTEWAEGDKVTGLVNGDKIIARLWDKRQGGEETDKTITDTILPEVKTLSAGNTDVTIVEAIDNESGIVGYAVTGTDAKPSKESFTSIDKTYKISNKKIETGIVRDTTYYVWVIDDAGNINNAKQIKTNIETYQITYNANGGSGEPQAQTKYYGRTLKLDETIPTREGYTFQGWATTQADANAGTVTYAAGADYTENAEATLWAVWKQDNVVLVKAFSRFYNTGSTTFEFNELKNLNVTNYKTLTVTVTYGAFACHNDTAQPRSATWYPHVSAGATLSPSDGVWTNRRYNNWDKVVTYTINVSNVNQVSFWITATKDDDDITALYGTIKFSDVIATPK